MFKNWNVFEKIWLCSFLCIGILVALTQDNNGFSLIVLLSGILCVVLAAKAHIANYYFGLFNSCCYAYLCYNNGLYGEWGLNLFFYVPTGIVGIMLWKKHIQQHQLKHIQSLSATSLVGLIFLNAISIAALGYILSLIPTQNTPYIDATTNALAMTATLLMMFRFREQWWFYIGLNLLTILMWAMRQMDGSQEGTMMVVMWFAFLINAFYGFYNWRKMQRNQVLSSNSSFHSNHSSEQS